MATVYIAMNLFEKYVLNIHGKYEKKNFFKYIKMHTGSWVPDKY